jgi:hypothetical protein
VTSQIAPLPAVTAPHFAGGAEAQAATRVARVAEFLLVGGVTPLLFAISWLVRKKLGLDGPEYAVGFLTFYGAYVINDPHFAVTYLLFYRNVRERAFGREIALAQCVRYWLAGLIAPALLITWAVVAISMRSAQSLGWMIQLMYLLVGWHYVKQGFGVLAVLASRRGTSFLPSERRILLAHCFAGWAYAWANPATAAGEFEEKGIVYRALAHPRSVELCAGAVLAASTAFLVAMLATKWRREKTLPYAPLCGFLITIWSWTIYSSFDRLVQYLIPALHSIQYLYFVWLMKKNEARQAEGPPSFGPSLAFRLGALALSALGLGWFLFHGAPTVLDAALFPAKHAAGWNTSLGRTPFLATFFVIVSIHHYFMDFVIWRRDNPDTKYLRGPGIVDRPIASTPWHENCDGSSGVGR